MGSNCVPLLADLSLYSQEVDFIKELLKKNKQTHKKQTKQHSKQTKQHSKQTKQHSKQTKQHSKQTKQHSMNKTLNSKTGDKELLDILMIRIIIQQTYTSTSKVKLLCIKLLNKYDSLLDLQIIHEFYSLQCVLLSFLFLYYWDICLAFLIFLYL